MVREPFPESIELVWDEGIRSIDAQLTEAAELDRETSPLIGLVSAGLALVIGQREPLGAAFGAFLPGMAAVLAYLLLGFRLRRFGCAPALPALVPWQTRRPARSASNALLVLLFATPFVIVFLGGASD